MYTFHLYYYQVQCQLASKTDLASYVFPVHLPVYSCSVNLSYVYIQI